jgi:hypothetical protein
MKLWKDSFLATLSEGEFQSGEIAKAYFASGHEIVSLDSGEALDEPNEF